MTTSRLRTLVGAAAVLALPPLAVTGLPTPPAHAAPPTNDDLAGAAVLTAAQNGSNVGSTLQAGEPQLEGRHSSSSVWYRLDSNGTALLDLELTAATFDTLLSVHEGSSLASLELVASNDDGAPGGRSRLENVLLDGDGTYYVRVAGYQSKTGTFTLAAEGHFAPTNDAFADAAPLLSEGVWGSNLGATREAGEPQHRSGGTSQTSVWWTYVPQQDGYLHLYMHGSDAFDSVMALYGQWPGNPSITTLVQVASDDDSGPGELSELTARPVVAGQTYWIAVSGRDSQVGGLHLRPVLDAAGDPEVTGVTGRVVPVRGGTRVTLRGSGFTDLTEIGVEVGDGVVAATDYNVSADRESITFTAPAAPAGTHRLNVDTEFGHTEATGANALIYLGRPRVTGLSRRTGKAWRRTAVVVRGTDLAHTTRVLVGGRAARFSRHGAALRVTMPRHRPGPVAIRVVTVGGTSAATRTSRFTYRR